MLGLGGASPGLFATRGLLAFRFGDFPDLAFMRYLMCSLAGTVDSRSRQDTAGGLHSIWSSGKKLAVGSWVPPMPN